MTLRGHNGRARRKREVLFFCSGTVALYRLVGQPTYPGIVDDYRATFAKVKAMRIDVLLGPHPEVYGMQDKRAQQIKSETPNPFIKPRELATYATGLADDFDKALAKQTAALQAAK
ncbi:metallo-beta-lactamase class B [Bradyrhizobium sp. Ghvi]|nr:metallo-beta-lactamase class B [Bradyrhizobium sp. Ghvi]